MPLLNNNNNELVARGELLVIEALKDSNGEYTIHLTSPLSTVVVEVGTDSVLAEAMFKDLIKRFLDTIDSEMIFLNTDIKDSNNVYSL